MRAVETFPRTEELKPTADQLARLNAWLTQEIDDAISARKQQEALWRELLRMYEGVPKNPAKYNSIIEGYEAIEITLGAIATDSIYAMAINLLYTVAPLVTSRAVRARWVPHAKALQVFVNHVAENEINLRKASEHTIFDNCQLGSGIYYIPFTERVKRTYSTKVVSRGPMVISVPPEDFLTPGGAYDDLQLSRWCAMRIWHTEDELQTRAKFRGWKIDAAQEYAGKDWVRTRREALARTYTNVPDRRALVYEDYDIYAHYDLDEDGFDEDILVSWNYGAKEVMKVRFNPYDTRPFEAMRYQLRPHLFPGIGVMEMTRPYQQEVTELHNHQIINTMLANTRMWAVRTGTLDEGTVAVWPNKVLEFSDPEADIKELKLSDINASLPQTQAMAIGLAEQRTGSNSMGNPRPSQIMGSRTPANTTIALLQQVNQRFTPAFDDIRLATGGAVKQAIRRYAELVQDGDQGVVAHIQQLLGENDAALLIELLQQPDYAQAVAVELTASSATANRDADRQNAVMLVNLLGQYYAKTLELVAIAANPQTPEAVRSVARKIADSAGELIDRTIRTFDQIRDPSAFIIQIEDELDGQMGAADAVGMTGLANLLLGGQQVPAGLPPGTA